MYSTVSAMQETRYRHTHLCGTQLFRVRRGHQSNPPVWTIHQTGEPVCCLFTCKPQRKPNQVSVFLTPSSVVETGHEPSPQTGNMMFVPNTLSSYIPTLCSNPQPWQWQLGRLPSPLPPCERTDKYRQLSCTFLAGTCKWAVGKKFILRNDILLFEMKLITENYTEKHRNLQDWFSISFKFKASVISKCNTL